MPIPSKTDISFFFSAEKRRLPASADLYCPEAVQDLPLLPVHHVYWCNIRVKSTWTLAGCSSPSLSNTIIINDFLAGDFGDFMVIANHQPLKWATSDTTGLLLSEEGPLVTSMVGSTEGPSWGMVETGWPRDATINRRLLVRRGPVTATPLTALVATLEELLMLEPRWGASQCSRAWKHL